MKNSLKPITLDDLPNWLYPGRSINFFYNLDNPNNHVEHVRAIIDDNYIVIREWSYRKKLWRYRIEHITYFTVHAQKSNLFGKT